MREHYTATVREDSKGQKTVTIPKKADIEDGDAVKIKKTSSWGYNETRDALEDGVEDAVEHAQFEAVAKWYGKDDMHAPDKIEFPIYRCNIGEGRDTCVYPFLRKRDLKKHLKEQHGIEEVDEDEHIIEEPCISRMNLVQIFPYIIRHLDLENKDLYSEDVADRIEEIVTSSHPDNIQLEKLHDYAHNLREAEE